MRKFLTLAALAGLVLAGAAVPADAGATVDRGRFDDDFAEERDGMCGVPDARLEGHDRGGFNLSVGGRDHLPRYSSTHQGWALWINEATGRALRAEWSYSNHDSSVVDAGDGTLRIVYQVTGPERFYGPDGQQLNLSTGNMRREAIVDHGGTPADPADDELISDTFLTAHGFPPQPPLEFCDSFRALTSG